MNGSSSNGPRQGGHRANSNVEIGSLLDLLSEQDEAMRSLFAKALNLYVSPGADATPEKEKLDRLKQAIEESLE
jgi:hypothetical protein